MIVVVVASTVVAAPVVAVVAVVGVVHRSGVGDPPPSRAALEEIPSVLLARYRNGERCAGVPWQLVAAIGWVASGHGRDGAGFDPTTATFTPPIIGPARDGRDSRPVVRVPVGGSAWHPDPVFDHPVGLMQLLSAVWSRHGVDGSGDGRADPHDANDAIATVTAMLCDGAPDPYERTVARVVERADVTVVLDTARRYGMVDGGDPTPPVPARPGPVRPVVNIQSGISDRTPGTVRSPGPLPVLLPAGPSTTPPGQPSPTAPPSVIMGS